MRFAAIDATGAWGVDFKRDKWNFQLDLKAIGSQEAMATWFKQVGDAIANNPVSRAEPPNGADEVERQEAAREGAKR